MFFSKKTEKWYKYIKEKPPLFTVVLMCNYDEYWIGKVMSVGDEKVLSLAQDEFGKFIFSSRYSYPIFWRYLPHQPERLNPEDA